MSQPVNLGPVQQTLLFPLLARALETKKQNGILSDPKALEMVNVLDYDFSKWNGSNLITSTTVRTLMYDADVRDFLIKHPYGTIVELGCGLNTRYERIDNGTAHWFDIDLPDVIELRRKFFKDGPRRKMITGNVLDDDWFRAVHQTGGPWCFISEGVIVYLDASQAKTVITRINESFPNAWLVVDTTPQNLVDRQRKNELMNVLSKESWFKWGCNDPKEIEGWTDGKLKLVRSKTFMDAPSDCWNKAPWSLWIVWKFFPWLASGFLGEYRMNVFIDDSQ